MSNHRKKMWRCSISKAFASSTHVITKQFQVENAIDLNLSIFGIASYLFIGRLVGTRKSLQFTWRYEKFGKSNFLENKEIKKFIFAVKVSWYCITNHTIIFFLPMVGISFENKLCQFHGNPFFEFAFCPPNCLNLSNEFFSHVFHCVSTYWFCNHFSHLNWSELLFDIGLMCGYTKTYHKIQSISLFSIWICKCDNGMAVELMKSHIFNSYVMYEYIL